MPEHLTPKMSSTVQPAQTQLDSLWKFGGLTPWRLTVNVFRSISTDDLLDRASGLAFDFVLAFFPLMLFILSVFGLFAARGSAQFDNLISYFTDFLPPSASQLVAVILDELSRNSGGGKLTLGIVAGVWFASGGVSSMISTLNVIYRVREARSWLRIRTTALGLTLVMAVLLLSALVMVLLGNYIADWFASEFARGSVALVAWQALRWPAAAFFVLLSFSLVYYVGPNLEYHRRHWITPGSLFGMLLWLASSVVLRVYLHFFNTYSTTYGSLGAVMILLLWLYVTGLVFLIGGEINAEIERAAVVGLPIS
jgi:membrane protein